MTIERKYFKEQNFVLTLIYGKLKDEDLLEHVSTMNEEYSDIAGIIELADCRYINDISELNPKTVKFLEGLKSEISLKKKKKCKKMCKISIEEYNNIDIITKDKKVYKCGSCGRVSNTKKRLCKPYKYK